MATPRWSSARRSCATCATASTNTSRACPCASSLRPAPAKSRAASSATSAASRARCPTPPPTSSPTSPPWSPRWSSCSTWTGAWRLLSVGVVPVFAFVAARVGHYSRGLRTQNQQQMADLNSTMQETLSVSGVLLIKTSGRRNTPPRSSPARTMPSPRRRSAWACSCASSSA